ncbi:hypothetical protein [Vibrio lentus]|uniref:hypothetical protein n=1 Tax=Vibrio lentus TaxID=136468 RepID=UPI001E440C36|nr:hypothetical protein [Vibrio lentus]MCC4838111.1 hypothetical protein [Vibrio lentus]
MTTTYRTKKDFATQEHKSKEKLLFRLLLLNALMAVLLILTTGYTNTVIIVGLLICAFLWHIDSKLEKKLSKEQVNWVATLSESERNEVLTSIYVKQVEKDNFIEILRKLEISSSTNS